MREVTRREFIGSAGACGAAAPRRAPNLLFVFSDQHSADMLGCYGNEQIRTPHLDGFASQGVRFRHSVSSYPVCTPYRAMLMSGQHPLYNGAIANDVPLLANNGPYLPHVLADAGYRLGYVGKWHLLGGNRDRPVPPGPMRYGFSGDFRTNNCHVDFRPGKCFYWNERGEKVFFDEWEVYGQTRQALEFLDGCPKDEPFALFVSWHPPHDWGLQENSLVYKYDTIPELMSLYDPAKIRLRPNVEDSPLVRNAYHGYYAMCSGVDQAFGRLLEKLDRKGLAADTIVVYTSDHGDNLASHGCTLPKNNPEDTSTRVPLMIRYPGRVRAGRASDLLVGTLDLMPTLLGMLGLRVPDTAQGRDLWPEIQKERDGAVESTPLMSLDTNWRGVYTREHVYAFGQGKRFVLDADGKRRLADHPVDCLYDRRRDPHQKRNLFGDRSRRALQEQLDRLAKRWLDRFEDPMTDTRRLMAMMKRNDAYPGDTRDPNFHGRPIDLIRGGGR